MEKIAQYPHRLAAFMALAVLFSVVPLSAVVVYETIIIGRSQSSAANPSIDITAGAVQTVYQNGVPHTDSKGNLRTTFGPDSFFPNGIYYPSSGSLASIGNAGFNSVILTSSQDPNTFLSEASTSGVKLIPNVQDSGHCQGVPSSPVRLPQYLLGLKSNPNVFAWHLWDDSLVCHSVAANTSLTVGVGPDPTPTYNFLTNEVSTYQPQTTQPFFQADSGPFNSSWISWWNKFSQIGNATVHYNYPVTTTFLASSGSTRIAANPSLTDKIAGRLSLLISSISSIFNSTANKFKVGRVYAATSPSLTFNWGQPTGYAEFSDGSKSSNCSGTGASCSTPSFTYWPGSNILYNVRVNGAGGPILKTSNVTADSNGQAQATWSWRYEVILYQASTIIQDDKSYTGTNITYDSTKNLLPNTDYLIKVCAPDCSSGVVWFTTTQTTPTPSVSPSVSPTPTAASCSYSFSPNSVAAGGTVVVSIATGTASDTFLASINPGGASGTRLGTGNISLTAPTTAGSYTVAARDDTTKTLCSTANPNLTVSSQKQYVYWVHISGQLDSSCCLEVNPSAPTTSTNYTFTLNTVPDSRGYQGVVCSPDCNSPVVWSGAVTFAPNQQGGKVNLTPSGSTTPPSTAPHGSFKGIADLAASQSAAVNFSKPSWFVLQDWAGSFFGTNWRFPTKQEARSMAYTTIIHGATGLFHFAWDSAIIRADCTQGVVGISPNTQTSYSGTCLTADSTQVTGSKNLWSALDASQNGINREILSLSPILLSPTVSDSYKVYVDQTPISTAPIRTMLKKYNGQYYLLAVNIDNATIATNFQFPGKNFSNAEVMFEGRNAVLVSGNSITETFGPFDVNVYKLTTTTTISPLVVSSRQICSLLGQNQTNVGIGGQDGGTSLKIGNESFWTFGDSLNLNKGLFLPNSIARTSATDASGCIPLTSKASGTVATALLNKQPDELFVWPDGMVSLDNSNGYFYYMSVRACKLPEACTFNSLGGSWKVRGIGLAKFDAATETAQRIGNCSPVTNCLFWQETDGSGIQIAGATATVDSNYVYVFLNESPDGVNQVAARLSRVPVGQIENKTAYQYWDGTNWVGVLRDSNRIMSFPGNFNGVSVAYNQFLGKWVAIYTTNDFSAVAAKMASSINGPWSSDDAILVDCKSVFPTAVGLKCYFGRQHPEFISNSGATNYVTYSNTSTYQVWLHQINFQATALPSPTPTPSPTPLVDSDHDGFPDTVEQYMGTDPTKACSLPGNINAWPPDFNNDGKVGFADLVLFAQHYNTKVGDANYNKRFDLDADGKIGFSDLAIFGTYYNKTCTPGT